MTLNAIHQFQFPKRKLLATLCSHPCSLARRLCTLWLNMPNVLDRCTGHLSNNLVLISKGQLITVCYVNNVFATRTMEVTLKPEITKRIFVQTQRQLNFWELKITEVHNCKHYRSIIYCSLCSHDVNCLPQAIPWDFWYPLY